MKPSKKTTNIIYICIISISIIAMIVLSAVYLKNKAAMADSADTSIASLKNKDDKVLITVSVETIEDGLANMGFLVTQEYYFTQVERYTKEKEIIFGITSSSEFLYSYDGQVFAGVDFEKIETQGV